MVLSCRGPNVGVVLTLAGQLPDTAKQAADIAGSVWEVVHIKHMWPVLVFTCNICCHKWGGEQIGAWRCWCWPAATLVGLPLA